MRYLTGTAGGAGTARWAPVLAALAAVPAPPVARALATPLMAGLARTVYNPAPSAGPAGLPDPAQLCDTTRLPTRTAVEEHLFDGLIPAAYRPHPGTPNRWSAEQAERYLAFLARHLEHRLHTTSLAWWELARATPRALPASAFLPLVPGGVLLGGVFMLVLVLSLTLVGGFTAVFRTAAPTRHVLRRPRLSLIVLMLVDWIPAGLAVGLVGGLVGGLAFGLWAGLAGWLLAGFAVGLMSSLEAPADTERAVDPWNILIQDRGSALLLGGLTSGLWVGLIGVFGPGLGIGLVFGLGWGITLTLGTAWGRLGLTRLWLASQRSQPINLMRFLADAHERGVLRQAGAVWEFRHANLQRRLANRPQ